MKGLWVCFGLVALQIAPASAQTAWQSRDGHVSVTLPEGWESFDEPGYEFFSESYIDDKSVATCEAKAQIYPNASGVVQQALNRRSAQATAETVGVSGRGTRFSNTRMSDGVQIVEFGFEAEEPGSKFEFSIVQFGFVLKQELHGYVFSCIAPFPVTMTTREEILDLLHSIAIERE